MNKYQLGEDVYFIEDNIVQVCTIIRIDLIRVINSSINRYNYFFNYNGGLYSLSKMEDKIFNTKKELLDSL